MDSLSPYSSNLITASIQNIETSLTDDLWYEIFLHLPVNPVFKFRCVSKAWSSLLSNPNFINQWYKLNTSLWTLVYTSMHQGNIKVTLSYPEMNSNFLSHHQSGFSFGFLNTIEGLVDALFILGSSNGLALCTNDFVYQKTYCVCNPLTKKSVFLPPPPKAETWFMTGFTCDESYKVIRVPKVGGASSFKVEIFSSDSSEWKVYNDLCPPNVAWNYSSFDDLVTHNGVFYWLQKLTNKILAFDVDRNNNNHGASGNECRLVEFPEQAMDYHTCRSQCLGESEGFICYAVIKYIDRSLSVWVLEEDWYLNKDIKFDDVLEQMKSLFVAVEGKVDLIREVQVLGFNPADKNVVILCYEKYVWAYNIRTRRYEQLSHPSFLGSNIPSAPHMALFTFAVRPRPTIIPPVSWSNASLPRSSRPMMGLLHW